MKGMPVMRLTALCAALALAGCATTNYALALMPRDSGKVYTGTADDNGRGEGRISITIEGKTYAGTWVETQPSEATAYVSGGLGWGWGWRGRGMGTHGTLHPLCTPQEGGAKG